MRRQASCVVANGFSQNTGLPASIAASTYSSCVSPHEVTTTASTSSARMTSCPLPRARHPRTPSATDLERSASTSVTATTEAPRAPGSGAGCGPGRSCRRRSNRFERSSPPTSDPDATQVFVGPLGNRCWHVELDRVQILLDDDEDVGVQLAQRVYDRRDVRLALGWFAAGVHRNRLAEREIVTLGDLHDLRVHLLDVYVADPVRVVVNDRHVVRVPVRQVAGVQAKRDVPRVGLVEEPLGLWLRLNVAVRMRVELQGDAV